MIQFNKSNYYMPGIYQIRNLINGKVYVGSSLVLGRRKKANLSTLRRRIHNSIYLQNSWNKYGEENFVFEIIEIIDNVDLILIREQYYLDFLKSYNKKIGYNICEKAGNISGFKHSEDTKKIISEKLTGIKRNADTIERSRIAQIGKKYSEEINKKKGRKGELCGRFGKGKPVNQYNLDGKFIREWRSGGEIERILGFAQDGISQCCNKKSTRKLKTFKGFIWKFKDENI